MIYQRPIVRKLFCSLFFLFIFSSLNKLSAQDGRALFQTNCASCHNLYKKLTGPALLGFKARGPWADQKQVRAWVHNPVAYMAKDPYTQGLKAEYGSMMQAFPNLGDKDIDAIADYIAKAPAAPGAGGAPGVTGMDPAAAAAQSNDNTLLFGILTLILAVIALILLQVNSNLRKLSDDKEGVPAAEPVPFYRNKAYIYVFTLLLFVVGGYYTIMGAIGLGRTKNYQPTQPIYYSHRVHAGKNQISCLYCHGNAQDGKHANIPSINQCMNCHIAINEYTGSAGKIYSEDGNEVNGTAEIKKIYEYAGWDPQLKKYTKPGKPVEWIKIHALPDHVYFNHSQHVTAGKVQCQTCHGPITEMDEVYQFAELSMGWCINCHRETKVQFASNKFYSIYEKFHNDLKKNPNEAITVEKIGGTECQKCHY
ncbi:MAG: c-type cytochrome [Williamsia sp.]|nr:c-type cytochrome [Williamsia sp.]